MKDTSSIFRRDDGTQLRFFVDVSGTQFIYQDAMVEHIRKSGGTVTTSPAEADIIIVEAETEVAGKYAERWGRWEGKVVLRHEWIAASIATGACLGKIANWGGYEIVFPHREGSMRGSAQTREGPKPSSARTGLSNENPAITSTMQSMPLLAVADQASANALLPHLRLNAPYADQYVVLSQLSQLLASGLRNSALQVPLGAVYDQQAVSSHQSASAPIIPQLPPSPAATLVGAIETSLQSPIVLQSPGSRTSQNVSFPLTSSSRAPAGSSIRDPIVLPQSPTISATSGDSNIDHELTNSHLQQLSPSIRTDRLPLSRGSGAPQSSLFITGTGEPIKFYLPTDIPFRGDLFRAIKAHGGVLVKPDMCDFSLVADSPTPTMPLTARSGKHVLRSEWVNDCVELGELLPTERYTRQPPDDDRSRAVRSVLLPSKATAMNPIDRSARSPSYDSNQATPFSKEAIDRERCSSDVSTRDDAALGKAKTPAGSLAMTASTSAKRAGKPAGPSRDPSSAGLISNQDHTSDETEGLRRDTVPPLSGDIPPRVGSVDTRNKETDRGRNHGTAATPPAIVVPKLPAVLGSPLPSNTSDSDSETARPVKRKSRRAARTKSATNAEVWTNSAIRFLPVPTAELVVGETSAHKFTDEDQQYLVEHLKVGFAQKPSLPIIRILTEVAAKAKHHGLSSWTWYYYKHKARLSKTVNNNSTTLTNEQDLPPPPPTPLTEGPRGSDNFSDIDEKYFVQYTTWKLRRDPMADARGLCDELGKYAPRHNALTWYRLYCSKPSLQAAFKERDEELLRREPTRAAVRPLLEADGVQKKPASKSETPTAPPQPPVTNIRFKGGCKFTDEHRRYLIDYARWKRKTTPNLGMKEILPEIAANSTHRSLHGWTRQYRTDEEYFIKSIFGSSSQELREFYEKKKQKKHARDESSEEDGLDGTDDEDNPTDGEQNSDSSTPTAHRSGGPRSRTRVVFSEQDVEDAMIHIEKFPNLGLTSTKLWKPFAKTHTNHSLKSWLGFGRTRKELIQRALRQRKGLRTTGQPSPNPAASDVRDSTVESSELSDLSDEEEDMDISPATSIRGRSVAPSNERDFANSTTIVESLPDQTAASNDEQDFDSVVSHVQSFPDRHLLSGGLWEEFADKHPTRSLRDWLYYVLSHEQAILKAVAERQQGPSCPSAGERVSTHAPIGLTESSGKACPESEHDSGPLQSAQHSTPTPKRRISPAPMAGGPSKRSELAVGTVPQAAVIHTATSSREKRAASPTHLPDERPAVRRKMHMSWRDL